MTRTISAVVGVLAYFVLETSGRAYEPCQANEDCNKAAYCAKRLNDCNGLGVCQWRPEACIRVWKPVCGCDGQTYSNACAAAIEGVNVDYEGECDPSYCWSNGECSELQYCFFEDCLLETGICRDRPQVCWDIWDPVCGCDGQTYSNACDAAAEGMSVDYDGECREEDPAVLCTGTDGTISVASCCESAGDFPDTCMDGPCGCSPEYSHDVLVCVCPDEQCFDSGVGCRQRGNAE